MGLNSYFSENYMNWCFMKYDLCSEVWYVGMLPFHKILALYILYMLTFPSLKHFQVRLPQGSEDSVEEVQNFFISLTDLIQFVSRLFQGDTIFCAINIGSFIWPAL